MTSGPPPLPALIEDWRGNRQLPPSVVRRLCVVCLLGFLLVLLVAAWLKPDIHGYGTHTQLGLPPCETSWLLGVKRCPSCGLTTGFAHLVRGQVMEAEKSNPLSGILFFSMLVCAGCAAHGAWTGRDSSLRIFLWSLGLGCVGILISWIYYFIHTPWSSFKGPGGI